MSLLKFGFVKRKHTDTTEDENRKNGGECQVSPPTKSFRSEFDDQQPATSSTKVRIDSSTRIHNRNAEETESNMEVAAIEQTPTPTRDGLLYLTDHKMPHCDVNFLNFCQLMIDVGQFRLCRSFMTGSQAEVEGNQASLNKFSSSNSMDEDTMIYCRNEYVFSATDEVPSDYRGEMFRYVTDRIHPGYVCLLREGDGSVRTLFSNFLPETERNGPAWTGNLSLYTRKEFGFTEEQAMQYGKKKDMVIACHSPYWPLEAVDWITRQRPQGSFSHDVMRRIVGYGCDFVCVSHKGYIERDNDHEWRFSFSMAELILIKNWSRQQRVVYRTVSVLHKRSLDTGRVSRLCTYHYKTLMLWAVETKSQCFWNTTRFFDSVRAILMDMIHCLKIKSLYHYFIPTNNLFDHLLSEDLSHDVNVLLCACENTDLIFEVYISCFYEEWHMSNRRTFVTMPQLLYASVKVIARLYNMVDSFTNLFCLLKRDWIQNSVNDVFGIAYGLIKESFLRQNDRSPYPVTEGYSGFNFFTENKSKNHSSDKNVHQIFKGSEIFDDAVRNNYGFEKNFVDYESWLQYCESADVVTTKMSAASKQMKYQLYSRCAVWLLAHRSLMTAVNVEHQESVTPYETDDIYLETLTSTGCAVSARLLGRASYFAYSPVRTPTVPISWFINKAYTANHYYTLLSDYKTSAAICDKIINVYNVSIGNQTFAEYGLPVLLSTQWIEIYDRELQQSLGLAALCRFVIHGSENRSVHLPTCPVQFALYLKVRCVIDALIDTLKIDTAEIDSDKIDQIFAHEYFQHASDICDDSPCFEYSIAALAGVLKIYARKQLEVLDGWSETWPTLIDSIEGSASKLGKQ